MQYTPGRINQSELSLRWARETGLTQEDARELLSSLLDLIVREVANGSEVSIPNFGTFLGAEVAAGTAYNPNTRERFPTPATKRVKFRPSETFTRIVKDGDPTATRRRKGHGA